MSILPSFSSSTHENPSTHFCTGAFPQVIIEPPSPKGCYRTEREMLKIWKKNPLSQKKKIIYLSYVFFQLVWKQSWLRCMVQLFPLTSTFGIIPSPWILRWPDISCLKFWFCDTTLQLERGGERRGSSLFLLNLKAMKAFCFCRNLMCRGLSAALTSAWKLINNTKKAAFFTTQQYTP